MSMDSGFDFLRFRDGTSHQQRTSQALNPDYFALDERKIADWLTFARRFSKTLKFYNADNRATGDWSHFLEEDWDLNELVAFIRNPSFFDHQPGKKTRYSHPHLALFLTFLALLEQAQLQMNTITKRQLDFYYQQALRIYPRSGQPDRIHLLAELEETTDQLLLPKATLLDAGEDEEGEPLLYQTEEDLIVNRATIAQIKNLYVQQEVQNIALIREENQNISDDLPSPKHVLALILRKVYRLPGTDSTPKRYPHHLATDQALDHNLLENLDLLRGFVENTDKLNLRLPTFLYIMELYQAWENPINWHRNGKEVLGTQGGGLNDYLHKAATARNRPTAGLDLTNKNFDQSFEDALGFSIDGTNKDGGAGLFEGMEGVATIYEFFITYQAEEDGSLLKNLMQEGIRLLGFGMADDNDPATPALPTLADFEAMMKLRRDTLRYLEEIIALLITANGVTGSVSVDPLAFEEGKTLYNIFAAIYDFKQDHLPNPPPTSIDLDFKAWDKEKLLIRLDPAEDDIDQLISAWKSHGNQAGFQLTKQEGAGNLNLGTGTFALRQLNDFSIRIPLSEPDSYLEIHHAGGPAKAEVILDETIDLAVGGTHILMDVDATTFQIRLKADQEGNGLEIALVENRAALRVQVEEWNKKTLAERSNFSLVLIGPAADLGPTNGKIDLEQVRKFSQATGGIAFTYTGKRDHPVIEIRLDLAAGDPPIFAFAEVNFDDEYFQIKAAQLLELEGYFNLQLEDFFFISELYEKGNDGSWRYKEPIWKWDRADQLLLDAHRTIHGPNAVPEIMRWKSIFIAPDATAVQVPAFSQEESFPRWKTFGKVPNPAIETDQAFIQEGVVGFLFASPSLHLSEGIRKITLSLVFDESGGDWAQIQTVFRDLGDLSHSVVDYPFSIAMSTAEGWVDIPEWETLKIKRYQGDMASGIEILADATDPNAKFGVLEFTLELDHEMPPLAPMEEPSYSSPWPALRLTLNQVVGGFENGTFVESAATKAGTSNYELLRNLRLIQLDLKVDVKELRSIQIQTQLGAVDPKGPFEPFGSAPQLGDRFFITHPELAGHQLTALSVHLNWKNLPDLEDYYNEYVELARELEALLSTELGIGGNIDESSFQLSLQLREGFRRLNLPNGAGTSHLPFVENPAAPAEQLEKYLIEWSKAAGSVLSLVPSSIAYLRDPEPVMADELLESSRYLQLELAGSDFLHNKYADLLRLQMLAGSRTGSFAETLVVEEAPVEGAPDSSIQFVVLGGSFAHNLEPSDILKVTRIQGGAEIDLPPEAFSFDKDSRQLTLTTGNLTTGTTEIKVTYKIPITPKEPYTPVIDGIYVDYEARAIIDIPQTTHARHISEPKRSNAIAIPVDQLFHVHPFGLSDLTKNGEWIKVADLLDGKVEEQLFFHLFPQYEDEGELYLGVKDLAPPQNLSLLFQLAEGSSNPDLPTAKVQWSYLAQHNWHDLIGEQIRMDATKGLQKSGIIQLAIPTEASLDHTRMPAGLHWIRARVKRHSGSINDTIAIFSQAIRAVRVIEPTQLSAAHTLAPEQITEPLEPIPGLNAFYQPYSSFGGKAPEAAPPYYLRVSERLRHKQRALTLWDYERLVLEEFPDVFKVKALSADLMGAGTLPGTITVIVIPDIRFRRPFDPFEPKVPQGQLQEIQQYLQDRAPTFARVKVQNPRFDYLHVRTPVKFHDMSNFDFYADRLNRELKAYLSPWAFDQGVEISFGQDIYLSMIVHFIENRDYVDFIDQPKMFLMERRASDGAMLRIPGLSPIDQEGNIQLRGPDVILVTVPDHTFDFLDDSIPPGERVFSGIGYAKLHLDFEVAKDKTDS